MGEAVKQRKFTWKRFIIIMLIILLVIIIGAFVFVNMFLNRSLPKVEGTSHIPVEQEVTVITDEHGVPHIEAKTLKDLYTAQGYVQAQSRMLQMELSRRQASGTLSEIVGEGAINNDKYFRTLGLRRAAEASYDLYSKEAKSILQWFSNGVNAYIDEAKANHTLPVEFTLLGAEPAPWTPIDSLTIGKYMAFDLGGNWERQAFNYFLLDTFPEEKALELFPAYPSEHRKIIEEGELNIARSFENAIIPEPYNGSNNWVVSGKRSASGKPLLADDPHLGLATPSIWYQMHLQAEEMNVSGVIFAGVPGIILGHNEHIAWGVTNTGPDVQQLYIEKESPDHENAYLYEGEWEEAKQIEEPIKVKGEETIPYEVIETRHGPIISEFAGESGTDDVLSLRWTALDPTNELQAIIEINRATNWEEFEKGLEKFHVPAQNFVFADQEGMIAYKANGKIPIYEDGEDALLPLPGWEEQYEWDGYIPFDALPKVINPEKGFIATANNKIVSDDYPYHITHVWAQPYRYERIYEVLAENDSIGVEDMMNLQMDVVNLRAREFIALFQGIMSEDKLTEAEKTAWVALNEWDYKDDATIAQPLIFDRWFIKMEAMLYEDIPEEVMGLFSAQGQTTDELLRLGDESIWVREQGGMEQLLHDSFSKAIAELEETYGTNQMAWQWGEYHQIQFKHPLSAANQFLAYIFNKKDPLPADGSAVTPMAAKHDETGMVNHGASWRFVVDLANLEKSYHIVSPGQSGHLKSPWYNDQTEDWVQGIYHETELANYGGQLLMLQPEK